ncbi:bile acid:sodium symporter family protein [Sphingomonas sp. C3-2]|uniref:bile acid:sodium symporter family protein n=1 Tax=Sphingomonas sp. C3-2 TaxID=3062169 RepID=UPI00294B209F|nr:bile acid:sodium symporter family protein [Sphingomonas sp. C3-2]WOK35850.1 bile acid:sodium symporter family protein [Sphingomonas sp. C3-2]
MSLLKRLLPDRFLTILIATVIIASLLPARGIALEGIGTVSTIAIFTLFFMHGARLSHQSVIDGLKRWRLQLTILLFGYGIMPLFGLGLSQLLDGWLSPGLVLGLIFLAVLPTTVQSSIAYSSISRGNVVGAVIASAASNLLGVILTPLLFTALASTQGGDAGLSAIGKIMLLLLLPFCLGQLLQNLVKGWVERHRKLVGFLDKATIVLAVYVAFSEAVTGGIWSRISAAEMGILVAAVLIFLALAFGSAWGLGRLLGKSRPDRITLLYSGAHKSLATGAPMIRILFTGPEAGAILLPLILYHQFQLMLSAVLSGRLARHDDADDGKSAG